MDKFIAYQEKARANKAFKDLKQLKKRITDVLDCFPETKIPKYTGWFVLIRENPKTDSGFEFLGFFNPDIYQETEPEWHFAIPIQSSETINEFQGW